MSHAWVKLFIFFYTLNLKGSINMGDFVLNLIQFPWRAFTFYLPFFVSFAFVFIEMVSLERESSYFGIDRFDFNFSDSRSSRPISKADGCSFLSSNIFFAFLTFGPKFKIDTEIVSFSPLCFFSFCKNLRLSRFFFLDRLKINMCGYSILEIVYTFFMILEKKWLKNVCVCLRLLLVQCVRNKFNLCLDENATEFPLANSSSYFDSFCLF